MRTDDGAPSAQFEHTALIGAHGPEITVSSMAANALRRIMFSGASRSLAMNDFFFV